ncbi:MAG: hypothetical protein HKN87_05570 [Saprospiraceae bacterium]|nr:hypothetical protein [Saprospiraceae bacterium]
MILLFGCKKEVFNPDFELGQIQACQDKVEWTEQTLENELKGSWSWVYQVGG